MNKTIQPGPRTGCVNIPISKSLAHRYLICEALAGNNRLEIPENELSEDIKATIGCLNVSIGTCTSDTLHLYSGESGTTLRFMLPLIGAKGLHAVFHMEDGLANRPIDELLDVLTTHGMKIKKSPNQIHCSGQLTAGDYVLPGNITSQYISGLLFALPLLKGDSRIIITESLESRPYVDMTIDVLREYRIKLNPENNILNIPGNQRYIAPDTIGIQRDWSAAAPFFCMGALSPNGICIKNIQLSTLQGDSRIIEIVQDFGCDILIENDRISVRKNALRAIDLDASDIPDLIPSVCALASVAEGTSYIRNAGRLRYKESDRIRTSVRMLQKLGADIEEKPDGMIIHGKKNLHGGMTESFGDHRIAMAAAVAACACTNDVTIADAECVSKSFPGFWEQFEDLFYI